MRRHMDARGLRRLTTLACLAALTAFGQDALGAPPWVDRTLTLPSGDWAFDFGLGLGPVPPPGDSAGVGINAEMAVGLTDRVELGLRTGLRFGDAFARAINGDSYGRLYDRQTFDQGPDVLANPEVRVRGALVRGTVVELALEGRLVVPIADGTDAGLLAGVPLAFHLGNRVRLDTGAYLPILFFPHRPVPSLNIPIDVWIQASRRLWLGPVAGVAFQQLGQPDATTSVSLGFALGDALTRFIDFKAMFLFPHIDDGSRDFGVGAGLEVRIE
jgi:hypothetical protein